jgi:hypothetical protein
MLLARAGVVTMTSRAGSDEFFGRSDDFSLIRRSLQW